MPKRLLIVVMLMLSSGCATILSGTRQKVTIETDPPGSTVVVIGTPVAPVLIVAGKASSISRKVLSVIGPAISEGAAQKLAMLDVETLVTRLVLWAKLDQVPPEIIDQNVNSIPPVIKDKLLDVLGVKAVGVSPMSIKLKMGREYAVLAWQQGYKVRLAAINPKFNWVTLLNFWNLFLFVPVDMLTGSWMKLTPKTLRMQLAPLGGT